FRSGPPSAISNPETCAGRSNSKPPRCSRPRSRERRGIATNRYESA
ncbi:wd repeat and fyve domain-containing protein, partial [Nannochloropsis gaditana CCMP526]